MGCIVGAQTYVHVMCFDGRVKEKNGKFWLSLSQSICSHAWKFLNYQPKSRRKPVDRTVEVPTLDVLRR